MHLAALAGATLGRLAHHAFSGLVGVALLRGASKAAPKAGPATRKAVVGGLAGGIVAARWLGSAARRRG